MADDPRAAMAEMVKDKTDEEIMTGVEAMGGVKGSLDQIFGAMVGAFQPDKAAGQEAVIQYDVTTDDKTYSYSMAVADGKCELKDEAGDNPRVTLELSFPNFLRLITGNLDGMQAFMSGQLKIAGDMMFAQVMQTWFAQGGGSSDA